MTQKNKFLKNLLTTASVIAVIASAGNAMAQPQTIVGDVDMKVSAGATELTDNGSAGGLKPTDGQTTLDLGDSLVFGESGDGAMISANIHLNNEGRAFVLENININNRAPGEMHVEKSIVVGSVTNTWQEGDETKTGDQRLDVLVGGDDEVGFLIGDSVKKTTSLGRVTLNAKSSLGVAPGSEVDLTSVASLGVAEETELALQGGSTTTVASILGEEGTDISVGSIMAGKDVTLKAKNITASKELSLESVEAGDDVEEAESKLDLVTERIEADVVTNQDGEGEITFRAPANHEAENGPFQTRHVGNIGQKAVPASGGEASDAKDAMSIQAINAADNVALTLETRENGHIEAYYIKPENDFKGSVTIEGKNSDVLARVGTNEESNKKRWKDATFAGAEGAELRVNESVDANKITSTNTVFVDSLTADEIGEESTEGAPDYKAAIESQIISVGNTKYGQQLREDGKFIIPEGLRDEDNSGQVDLSEFNTFEHPTLTADNVVSGVGDEYGFVLRHEDGNVFKVERDTDEGRVSEPVFIGKINSSNVEANGDAKYYSKIEGAENVSAEADSDGVEYFQNLEVKKLLVGSKRDAKIAAKGKNTTYHGYVQAGVTVVGEGLDQTVDSDDKAEVTVTTGAEDTKYRGIVIGHNVSTDGARTTYERDVRAGRNVSDARESFRGEVPVGKNAIDTTYKGDVDAHKISSEGENTIYTGAVKAHDYTITTAATEDVDSVTTPHYGSITAAGASTTYEGPVQAHTIHVKGNGTTTFESSAYTRVIKLKSHEGSAKLVFKGENAQLNSGVEIVEHKVDGKVFSHGEVTFDNSHLTNVGTETHPAGVIDIINNTRTEGSEAELYADNMNIASQNSLVDGSKLHVSNLLTISGSNQTSPEHGANTFTAGSKINITVGLDSTGESDSTDESTLTGINLVAPEIHVNEGTEVKSAKFTGDTIVDGTVSRSGFTGAKTIVSTTGKVSSKSVFSATDTIVDGTVSDSRFTGANTTVSGTVSDSGFTGAKTTVSGTVSASEFAGANTTVSGTVSASKFTGANTTVSGTVSGSEFNKKSEIQGGATLAGNTFGDGIEATTHTLTGDVDIDLAHKNKLRAKTTIDANGAKLHITIPDSQDKTQTLRLFDLADTGANADNVTIGSIIVEGQDSDLKYNLWMQKDKTDEIYHKTFENADLSEKMNADSFEALVKIAASKPELKEMTSKMEDTEIADFSNRIVESTTMQTQAAISGVLDGVSSATSGRMEALQVAGKAAGDADSATHGIWMTPFYSSTTQKDWKNVSGYKSQASGATIGVDVMANDDLTIGLAGTYARTDVKHKGNKSGDNTKIDSLVFSLYATQQLSNNWFLQAQTSFANNKVKSSQKRKITGSYETAKGKFDTTSYTAELLAGYNYAINDAIITPLAGARFSRISGYGYEETGTTNQNLHVGAKASNKLEAVLGLQAQTTYAVNGISLTPEMHVMAKHDLIGKNAKVITNLTEKAGNVQKTKLNAGLGLNAVSGMYEFGAGYDLHIAKKSIGHQGTLKVRLNF